MINLIKCGIGNIGSVKNALNQIGCNVNIVERPDQFNLNLRKIILPGVGSFDSFIYSLKQSGLFNKIIELVEKHNFTIMGICVGLQSFFHNSEEGNETGMSLIKGNILKIKSSTRIKIPHMGWNDLIIKNKNSNLLKDIPKNKFYFAHSFYAECTYKENIIATVIHGQEICSIVNYRNIYGVQFHPEKSYLQGQKILKNFIDLC